MQRPTIDFGIDLGTTNSAIACMENGTIRIFKNSSTHADTTPSVVQVDKALGLIVGQKAYENLWNERKARGEFKRFMGTPQVLTFAESGQSMTPEQLSAEVLKSLKRDVASATNGEDIHGAVIGVPAAFQSVQCNATKNAADMAGITTSYLLQEPIAAALAYGLQLSSQDNGYWLVYDLGGGTFDVAIIESKAGRLRVVEHAGDNYLGGKDFDRAVISKFLLPRLRLTYELPPEGTEKFKKIEAKLKLKAEKVKIELSTQEKSGIELDGMGEDQNGKEIEGTLLLSRPELNALISSYVERSIDLCNEALKSSRLTAADISKVVLVGGPTYTPLVRDELKSIFGHAVDTSCDPMTAVAIGAAIHASGLELPSVSVPVSNGQVQVKLVYERKSTDLEELVAIKVLTEATSIKDVQISRVDGGFQSGRIPLNNGFATLSVSLFEKRTNSFKVNLFDSAGRIIPCDPDTITITQGLSAENPPLPNSIGVELLDEATGLPAYEALIARGTVLPAKGKKTFKARAGIRKGEEDDRLRVIVLEGENKVPDRNRWLGRIKIDGRRIERTLPENSEIEVTIEVDESRLVKASAYIPFLDKSFSKIIDKLESQPVNLKEVKQEIESAKLRRENILRNTGNLPDESAELEIRKLERADDIGELQELAEQAELGDQDSLEKVFVRSKDLHARLDRIEQAAEEPMLRRELEELVGMTDTLVQAKGTEAEKREERFIAGEARRLLDRIAPRKERITELIEKYHALRHRIFSRDPEYWQYHFSLFVEGRNAMNFSDKDKAKKLIEAGINARDKQDFTELEDTVKRLYNLLSPEERIATETKAGIKL